MTQYIAYAVGVLGFAYGAYCYRELWKWAKMCQRAKIAIAYNKRVQLDAPLTEWLVWANALNDEQRNGRVVYRNGKMSVAILRPDKRNTASTTIRTIRGIRRRKKAAPAA